MSGQLIPCPLCPWTIERPEPQFAPAVAAALGVPTDALAAIHQQQNMRRLEHELEQHLGSHKLPEWVAALTKARAERWPEREQVKAEAIREAAAAQRSLASASKTRDGKFEHEAIADWLDQRADEVYVEATDGAHP
jgi:hypothetical protein